MSESLIDFYMHLTIVFISLNLAIDAIDREHIEKFKFWLFLGVAVTHIAIISLHWMGLI